MMIRFIKT